MRQLGLYICLVLIIGVLMLKMNLSENLYTTMGKLDSLQIEKMDIEYDMMSQLYKIEIAILESKLAICKGDTVIVSDSLRLGI